MRIPRRKGGAGPLAVGAPSRKTQVAAVFALAALLGVSVLYDSAHIAASLRRHGGGGSTRAYSKLSSADTTAARSGQDEPVKPRAPPAQEAAESAAATTTEPTDRADPPLQKEHQDSGATPGATAGSSQQDAPLLEQVVEGGGSGEQQDEEPAGSCDLYRGRWVHDDARAPLYKERECGFLTEQVTCTRNGRRDDDYQKWRWQPDGCDLPRFEAKVLLERLRNKRLMFVGDSLNRNQWESMVCLVQSEAPWDKKSLVKNGSLNVFRLQGAIVRRTAKEGKGRGMRAH